VVSKVALLALTLPSLASVSAATPERSLQAGERMPPAEVRRLARSGQFEHAESVPLTQFARIERDAGEVAAAAELTLRADRLRRAEQRLLIRHLPERQALHFAAARRTAREVLLGLVARVSELEPSQRTAIVDAVIRGRALVLDEMAARRRTAHATDTPGIAGLVEAVTEARQRLASLVTRGHGPRDLAKHLRELEQAGRAKEQAERALAEKSATFRAELAWHRAGIDEVLAALPAESALLGYVRYSSERPPHERGRADLGPPPASYLAFVLDRSGRPPVLVPLGPAQPIEAAVARWREEASRGPFVKGRTAAEADARYADAGRALREAIWDPLTPHLGESERLFVVPDAALHLVSLQSLPTAEDRYLVEDGPLLHYLAAERDLVRPSGARPDGGLLAVGGPAFDATSPFASLTDRPADEPDRAPSIEPVATVAGLMPFRGGTSRCEGFQNLRFRPLPAAAQEAEEVVALWTENTTTPERPAPSLHLEGPAATESAVKRYAPGRRILHLATHGFFLGDGCRSAIDDARGIGGLDPATTARKGSAFGDNPLLHAGLAFAGANHRDAAGPEEDDGVLTAEEIAALDLTAVEWAVLSACDSGTGTVRAGEGVFGLRRAFQIAGVETVIMSLWSVKDEPTRQWMNSLYQARLELGMSTSEAVGKAYLDILEKRRRGRASTHPFYWAAFAAVGDWR